MHTKRSKLSHATRDRRAEKRRLDLQKFDIYLEDVDEQTYDSRDSREDSSARRSSDHYGSPRAQSERAETAYIARMRREATLEPRSLGLQTKHTDDQEDRRQYSEGTNAYVQLDDWDSSSDSCATPISRYRQRKLF